MTAVAALPARWRVNVGGTAGAAEAGMQRSGDGAVDCGGGATAEDNRRRHGDGIVAWWQRRYGPAGDNVEVARRRGCGVAAVEQWQAAAARRHRCSMCSWRW
jgi:hypothetical protein